MSKMFTVSGFNAVPGIEGLCSSESGVLGGGIIAIAKRSLQQNMQLLSAEPVPIRATHGRVTKDKEILLVEKEEGWDKEAVVLLKGHEKITCPSFNNEEGPRQTVYRVYHRLPPVIETAETDVERKSFQKEALDQGLEVVRERENVFLVRFKYREAGLRLAIGKESAFLTWKPPFLVLRIRQTDMKVTV